MYILERGRAVFVAQAESLHEYTAYGHTLSGKGPANFAGHSTRRPDTDVWTRGAHPESVPGRVCKCSFGKCLPPHHCRPIYVLLSDSYTSLARDAKAVRPSTVLYPLVESTANVPNIYDEGWRFFEAEVVGFRVLFLGRLAN